MLTRPTYLAVFSRVNFLQKGVSMFDNFSLDELGDVMMLFARAYFVRLKKIDAANDGLDNWREDHPTEAQKLLKALAGEK